MPSGKVGFTSSTRKSRKSERLKNLVEASRKEVVENGDGGRREKTEERDGTGGVCARASVATVYARWAGRLLKRSLRCLALANALI
eukprot:2114645-Pleurochrysis_carterae.AAC.1